MKKITALLLVVMCTLGAWSQSDRRNGLLSRYKRQRV